MSRYEEHDRPQEPISPEEQGLDPEALDSALKKLEAEERHREKSKIVELHCFAGLTLEQTAQALKKPLGTVKRDWTFAKAWLYRELAREDRR